MADFKPYKVNSLPTSNIDIDGIYYVKTGNTFKAYIRNQTDDDWIEQEGADLSALEGRITQVETDVSGAVSGFQGSLAIADTPTEVGYYIPTEEGTYTNAGGLTYEPSTTDEGKLVQFIYDGTNWSKNSVFVGGIDLAEMNDKVSAHIESYFKSEILTESGTLRATNGDLITGGSYRHSTYIDLEGVSRVLVNTEVGVVSASPCIFYDENKDIIKIVQPISAAEHLYVEYVPEGAKFMRVTSKTTEMTKFNLGIDAYLSKIFEKIKKPEFAVVALDGDDVNGDGSVENPFASLSKSYSMGFKKVKLRAGIYKNLANPAGYVELDSYNDEYVELWNAQNEFDTKTLESGYTNVWEVSDNFTKDNGHNNFWIDNLPDERTLINIADRLPIHEDRSHRLSSTRIEQGTSMSDLENSSYPKWLNENGKLYVSNIGSVDLSVNKIIVPTFERYLFGRIKSAKNITFKYASLTNIDASADILFENCKIFYSTDSGISKTNGRVKIINCEIGGGYNNGVGYGYNAIGEEINVWCHDWQDEGSSAHSETNVKRVNSYYTDNDSPCIDVGNSKTLMENCVLLKNTKQLNFSYQGSEGNALLVNVVSDGVVNGSPAGRVKKIGGKFSSVASNVVEL